eukprot:TRINITY_DN8052_c0_g1_i3.p2 TRINITY_DN8052_c0_g1~~TRINITY_DN8052_c0_g1_i3.p2  ORF type:complete len:123 (+),score=13.18 TRINITY_DN8052_c0_g1_i3:841-1209(+)
MRSSITPACIITGSSLSPFDRYADHLEYVGSIPFDVFEPVLRNVSMSQLCVLEDHNPQFQGRSEDRWQQACNHLSETERALREPGMSYGQLWRLCRQRRQNAMSNAVKAYKHQSNWTSKCRV